MGHAAGTYSTRQYCILSALIADPSVPRISTPDLPFTYQNPASVDQELNPERHLHIQ